jgi:hypothetical protein
MTAEELNAYDLIARLPTNGQASDFLLSIHEGTPEMLKTILTYFAESGFDAELILETTAREVKVS